MQSRFSGTEILDRDDVSESELRASFGFMRMVNRFFGGTRAVLDYFSAHSLPSNFSVLDLGFGGGDIAYALSAWAKAQGKQAVITGVDINPFCVAFANEHFKAPSLRYFRASAFDLGSLGEFDYIISSMFFHHLNNEEIVRLLRLMAKHARRGFLVNDLYRSWPAYGGAVALALPTFQGIILNDAPVSVKRAFKEEDFERYRDLAAIPSAKISRKPVFRITLSQHA